ncbi:MAG TPA: hypothetical protein P5545_05770 [Bacteroidota bacterium]|nr:hypothetical protein [Candidatus Kapabacteria bacterium]HRS02040.1 hypothetical protein [Bacteroidota bacterium]HRT68004.1 hypothetical protein [Bacteroidota bacterium]
MKGKIIWNIATEGFSPLHIEQVVASLVQITVPTTTEVAGSI